MLTAVLLIIAILHKTSAQCTAAGRFADTSVTDCTAYILCAFNQTSNTYVQYSYTCPTTSFFNPAQSLCSTSYTCDTTTTVSTVATTTVATTDCTAAGRIPDPSVTDCTQYILCVVNGTAFSQYIYTCPGISLFNPNTAVCTTTYTCPNDTVTTTVATTTTAASVCTAEGFIADPSSTDCLTYILCVDNGDGTFTEQTLTCDAGFPYNPATTLCDATYVCTATVTTTESFTCTTAGRFADPSVDDCVGYIYCVQNGTDYLSYQYTCPGTSVFNPNTSVCTNSYTCT